MVPRRSPDSLSLRALFTGKLWLIGATDWLANNFQVPVIVIIHHGNDLRLVKPRAPGFT
jgi:hypothetical protein